MSRDQPRRHRRHRPQRPSRRRAGRPARGGGGVEDAAPEKLGNHAEAVRRVLKLREELVLLGRTGAHGASDVQDGTEPGTYRWYASGTAWLLTLTKGPVVLLGRRLMHPSTALAQLPCHE